MNFWNELERPILCLAPMADVTDRAFRQIIAKYSKITPHPKSQGAPLYATYTEFVSADGLFSGGYDALINDLAFTEEERPIVAQFFTSKPEMMEKAAALAVELGFGGVDINMGCPDKSVEKQKAGAALIKNPKLAQEIILAAKKGARNNLPASEAGIPVSVKTRIGYNKNELETWLPAILETEPAAVIVHARTRKNLSLVPADWEYIKRAVEIRDEMKNQTLILGNGDVRDLADAKQKAKETSCDGVMIGRGIFGNPWLFAGKIPTMEEKLKVLIEHAKLFEKLVQPKPVAGKAPLRQGYGGQGKSFAVMKKHFKAYVNGFDGAKELRVKLMESENAKEVEKTVKSFLKVV